MNWYHHTYSILLDYNTIDLNKIYANKISLSYNIHANIWIQIPLQ